MFADVHSEMEHPRRRRIPDMPHSLVAQWIPKLHKNSTFEHKGVFF